jgi:hypothetical protein
MFIRMNYERMSNNTHILTDPLWAILCLNSEGFSLESLWALLFSYQDIQNMKNMPIAPAF